MSSLVNKNKLTKEVNNFGSMQKKELLLMKNNSNSKDQILLVKEGSEFIIQKNWVNVERGFRSIKKQIEFDEIRIKGLIIRSPKVFSTQRVSEKEFIAKMEYIDGFAGQDIVNNGSRKISLSLKNAFSMIINNQLENSVLEKVSINIFLEKIDSILISSKFKDIFSNKINLLREKFARYQYIEIPIGPCHGDLTLSNVIVSSTGSLNLIDFLPTFVESPLWDIVKLNQDLKNGWSYRNLNGPSKASAKLFFKSCIPKQLEIYKKVWNNQISLLNALNFARITPYIKDNITKEWVDKNFSKALLRLNN
mgnify:CR=1 FL=1|tara:strand:+ start:297 stop:1217 length:921 start_codon:yes stop_codon:yes gene_type:complete